jgi:hypothetical protein
MRHLVALVALLSFAPACATNPRLNCDEGCALRGMRCQGTTVSEGTAETVGAGYNVYSTSASAESFSCEKPKSPTEEEAIGVYAQNATTKVEKAKSSSTAKTLLLIGGIIVLGIAAMPK